MRTVSGSDVTRRTGATAPPLQLIPSERTTDGVLAESLAPTEVQAPADARRWTPGTFRRVLIVGDAIILAIWLVLALYLVPRVVPVGSWWTWGAVPGVTALMIGTDAWMARALLRADSQRFTRLTVSDRELVAVRSDGTTVTSSWGDPALRLLLRNFRPADARLGPGLDLSSGAGRAYGPLTREGATLLEGQAARHGLLISAETRGKPPREWTVVEIRPMR